MKKEMKKKIKKDRACWNVALREGLKPEKNLQEMIRAITPENTHAEILIGSAVGKELW